jgi:ribosomal protein L11 methyltransferase
VRTYPAIEITATGDIDLLIADLADFGASAVEDVSDGVRVFFSTHPERDAALAILRARADLACEPLEVPDEDWAARSQAALKAITVGDITVAPPWTVTDELRARTAHIIVIQPSMGFGTGHHASTRLCLSWLQRTTVTGASVLDVGTGSGVLAIAAVQLGAADVAGIDVDPDALTAARENAELNHTEDRISWQQVDLSAAATTLGHRFSVICANLTGGLLFRDAHEFGNLALPGAHLIASGFQPHEAAHVVAALKAAGWSVEGHLEEEDWVGVRFGFHG